MFVPDGVLTRLRMSIEIAGSNELLDRSNELVHGWSTLTCDGR
jgi:hypothetical protein